MDLHGTLLFHLNLQYSSIEPARHGEVVRSCYRPLLGLLDEVPGLVLAIEASAATLEAAGELDPEWLATLRARVEEGRVEFVGAGDTQLIGPLVPAAVNRWNQRLGQEAYERLLGRRPTVALVNELAWSAGLVEAYRDAGYRTLLVEWNNPRRRHPDWDDEWRFGTATTSAPAGGEIELLWIDSVAFQKFQRTVCDEIDTAEYLRWLGEQSAARPRHLFLYASDAEVFDFRPGRFLAEPRLRGDAAGASEWERMADLVRSIAERGVRFTKPADVRGIEGLPHAPRVTLGSAADPIPVKKQPKYNVTRWALSGRDDIGLNTRCFARARALEDADGAPEAWRALCRDWSSDRRTHLTDQRWEAQRAALDPLPAGEDVAPGPALEIREVFREEHRLTIETDGLRAVLSLRRGLAIEALHFAALGGVRLLGTLPHGYFDTIDWAADFYSGHTIVEIPGRSRVTDLLHVEPRVDSDSYPDRVVVTATVDTPLGPLEKCVEVHADRFVLRYGFSGWGVRPAGSVRTGIVTLDPGTFGPELNLTCASGGAPERFTADAPFDHGGSVSMLVSASAAFGATDGRLTLDDGRVALDLDWRNDRAAALPLVTWREIQGRRFVRVACSLAEVDETSRPSAPLPDFELSLAARRLDS